ARRSDHFCAPTIPGSRSRSTASLRTPENRPTRGSEMATIDLHRKSFAGPVELRGSTGQASTDAEGTFRATIATFNSGPDADGDEAPPVLSGAGTGSKTTFIKDDAELGEIRIQLELRGRQKAFLENVARQRVRGVANGFRRDSSIVRIADLLYPR